MRKALIGTFVTLALACGAAAPSLADVPSLVGTGIGLPSPERLKGANVLGGDGEKIGEVTDVIVDRDGGPRQIVVSAIDLLRIGGKEIAIDVADVRLRSDSRNLYVPGIRRADVATLPEYTPGEATSLGGR